MDIIGKIPNKSNSTVIVPKLSLWFHLLARVVPANSEARHQI